MHFCIHSRVLLSGLLSLLIGVAGCARQTVQTFPSTESSAISASASPTDAPAVLQTTAYSPQVLWSDGGWNGISVASSGQVYFALSSHNLEHHGIILRFDPAQEQFHGVADLGKITQTPLGINGFVPQGKVHTPFYEHDGYLYFATHVGAVRYAVTSQRKPYPGGQFQRLSLKDHQAQKLGDAPKGQGIITLVADFSRQRLYGLTWPSSEFLICDLAGKQVRNLGPTETYFQPASKDRDAFAEVCRSMVMDPTSGRVFGTRIDGTIYVYDPATDQLTAAPVNLRTALGIAEEASAPRVASRAAPASAVPPSPPAPAATRPAAPSPRMSKHNWRTILYDPVDRCFYGVHEDSSTLFRMDPQTLAITSLAKLLPRSMQNQARAPGAARLALAMGPDRVLWQIVHGPGVAYDGRTATRYQAYLVSYDLKTGKLTDHGMLAAGRRRVLYSDSLAVAADGRLWCLAMVEVIDPLRNWLLQTQGRGEGSSINIGGTRFEMLLLQINPR